MLVPLKGYGVNAAVDLQVGELAVVVAGELAMGGNLHMPKQLVYNDVAAVVVACLGFLIQRRVGRRRVMNTPLSAM